MATILEKKDGSKPNFLLFFGSHATHGKSHLGISLSSKFYRVTDQRSIGLEVILLPDLITLDRQKC